MYLVGVFSLALLLFLMVLSLSLSLSLLFSAQQSRACFVTSVSASIVDGIVASTREEVAAVFFLS